MAGGGQAEQRIWGEGTTEPEAARYMVGGEGVNGAGGPQEEVGGGGGQRWAWQTRTGSGQVKTTPGSKQASRHSARVLLALTLNARARASNVVNCNADHRH